MELFGNMQIYFIDFAGTPTAVQRLGSERMTTAPAPMMVSLPMSIRLIILAPVPAYTASPILTSPEIFTEGINEQ